MTIPYDSPEDFDERAHQCYDAGEYDLALEILHTGLCRYPDAADLHVGLGYVRMAREEFAWARQAFEAALAVEPDHEDACVGLGEALLKFGDTEAALCSFRRVDELGLGTDPDLGLAIGRALYREGLFTESRRRLSILAEAHPRSAEIHAALAYTLHALGDEAGAYRALRRALRFDAEFHEARIYLSHLLYERGDHQGALRELDRVPPAEHWDSLSLWRVIDLKASLEGLGEEDPALVPWRTRLAELETEPDAIDHLLAEVEMAFADESEGARADISVGERPGSVDERPGGSTVASGVHRVRTVDGVLFVGTWEQIVCRIRDRTCDASAPITTFMRQESLRVRRLTGCELPFDNAEAFLRASALIGLLQIEV
jgi:tetratricopeptide (TPR) repeat protein